MPRAKTRCPRTDCDEVAPCGIHQSTPRPSRHARMYDSEHDRRAVQLRRDSERLNVGCSLCGQPINYELRSPHRWSFVAHHATRDKRGPLAPAHRVCNERAGKPRA